MLIYVKLRKKIQLKSVTSCSTDGTVQVNSAETKSSRNIGKKTFHCGASQVLNNTKEVNTIWRKAKKHLIG